MKWFRRFLPSPDDTADALAAKIEASVERRAAQDRYAEATAQSERLENINQRNHFSESLSKAFRERPL